MIPHGFQAAARRHRSAAVIGSLSTLVPLTYVSLWTVVGQNLDTLAMEAMVESPIAAVLHLDVLRAAVSVPGLVVASVLLALAALLRRRPALAWRALLVVGGVNLTAQLLKAILSRPYLGVSFNLQNSYPSGHVAYAAAISIALIMVAPKGWRSPAALLGWVWSSLMGIMVISAGWHRLADVVASLLIAAIWGFAAAPAELRSRAAPRLVRAVLPTTLTMIVAGITLLVVAGVVLSPNVASPLHQWQMLELITASGVARNALFGAVLLLVSGVGGLILNGVDRLSAGR